MRKAWIENDIIRDIAPHGDPAEFYHPDIAVLYDTEVPDEAANGDTFVNGVLTKAPEPEPVVPPVVQPEAPKVSPVQFKLLFTSPERIAIKAARANDPVVDDFFDIVEDPRLTHVDLGLQSTSDALTYLTAVGLLAAGRKEEILLGVVN